MLFYNHPIISSAAWTSKLLELKLLYKAVVSTALPGACGLSAAERWEKLLG